MKKVAFKNKSYYYSNRIHIFDYKKIREMKIKFIVGVFALVFAYGCTAKKVFAPVKEEPPIAVISEPIEEKLVITALVLVEGKSMYEVNCAKCHKLYDKSDYSASEWKPIVLRMQKNTRISDEQREKIYAYLTTPQM